VKSLHQKGKKCRVGETLNLSENFPEPKILIGEIIASKGQEKQSRGNPKFGIALDLNGSGGTASLF
jgi:hypothetical protein